jgi:hypothetical protein
MAEGRIINHAHEDGRQCILGPDGIWRHWDNDGVIPGPRDAVDWKCEREHPCAEARRVDISGPEPVPVNPVVQVMEADNDRGEFGMPTIGIDIPPGPFSTEMPPWGLGPGKVLPVQKADVFDHDNGMRCVITTAGISIDYGENGVDQDAMTDEARVILGMVPGILLKFLEKNEKYARAQTGHDLGAKGVIPDINRKSAALITAIWDGVETPSDLPTELAEDLIGHLLLLLAKMAD